MDRMVKAGFVLMALMMAASGASGQTTVGPFTYTATASSGTLLGKATIDGVPASAGDVVGVFDSDGNTAGAAEVIINAGEAYINVVIYGDDPTTAGVDEGIDGGEDFTLVLWDSSIDEELDGPTLSGWENTNGAPMAGFNDPNDEYDFEGAVVIPGAPTLVSPDDGATDIDLSPTLSWNAVAGADTYDVQVAEDAGFASIAHSTSNTASTSANASGLEEQTQYYWRVRAGNAGGDGDWSASRSFTTRDPLPPPDPPDPIALVSPANGAVDQPVETELTWTPDAAADTYDVQVATDEAFTQSLEEYGSINGTSLALNGLANLTTYYWRVRGVNEGGNGDYSTVRSFTTVIEVPASPTLALPLDNALDQSISPLLDWDAAERAQAYRIQVATEETFSSPLVDESDVAATEFALTNLTNDTRHYWRVAGTNAGGIGAWSQVWSFTTLPATPGIPQPTSPAVGATNVPLPVELAWTSVAGTTSYSVEVALDANFNTLFNAFSGIATTSLALEGLENLTLYYWRVRASNAGGESDWSAAATFTTIVALPDVPAATSPADLETGLGTTVQFVWQAAARADSYDLQVSEEAGFANIVTDRTGLAALTHMESGLDHLTTYYWRLRARNAAGASDWNEAGSFTTGPPDPPDAPLLVSPADGATDVVVIPVLSWEMAPRAVTYEVRVAHSAGLEDAVFVANDVAEMTATSDSLEFDTEYFWSVRAQNAGGTSDWSVVRSFRTMELPPPPAPVLASPADGQANINANDVLTWDTIPIADTYDLQVSRFGVIIVDESGLTTNSFLLENLDNLTEYFWRVRARNAAGIGSWSSVRTFITAASVGAEDDAVPVAFKIQAAFPNPVSSTARLPLTVDRPTHARIDILDAAGRERGRILDEVLSTGHVEVSTDVRGLESGLYAFRIVTDRSVEIRTFVVVKTR